MLKSHQSAEYISLNPEGFKQVDIITNNYTRSPNKRGKRVERSESMQVQIVSLR